MGSFSQKSVSFALVPSTTTSEDSDSRNTPSPAAEDMEDKGKKTPRAIHEQSAASSTTGGTWPRHSPPPPRSALRPPSSLRGQSTDRAYVPARPSPLARATLTSDAHPVVDAPLPPPLPPPPSVQQDLAPPRQLSMLDPANRSSDISAPSEYSQEGTASDVEPPVRMLRAPDGRLYPHRETEELSRPDAR